jgi:hypothetical protein
MQVVVISVEGDTYKKRTVNLLKWLKYSIFIYSKVFIYKHQWKVLIVDSVNFT